MKRTVFALAALLVIPPAVCHAADMNETLLRFTGRLHPSLVHFPIALFIVAAFLETLRLVRRKPEVSPSALTCVILGAISAGVVAFSGWMNADFESRAESLADTLFWHRWLGVSVAGIGVILAGLAISSKYFKAKALQRVYALLLLATAAMVGFTGHLGGSMVYGPDYMFEVFSAEGQRTEQEVVSNLPVRTAPAGATLSIDFARDIQPIFTKNCIECHGPSKKKGGIRLDHPGFLFTLPEDAWPVVPESPEKSDLVRRISAKTKKEGRMPPKGDALPAEQVEKIRQWVAEGAYWGADTKAGATPEPAAVPVPTPAPAPEGVVPAWSGDEVAAIAALRAVGGRVEPIAADSADLDINLSLAGAKATDAQLQAVGRLGSRVRTLNLARTGITDAGMASLRGCAGLEKLHLEGTGVGDASVQSLAKLAKLDYLNLNGTKVTDAGIAGLAACKSLKNLYVAETAVTLDGAMKLQDSLPALNIEVGIPKP